MPLYRPPDSDASRLTFINKATQTAALDNAFKNAQAAPLPPRKPPIA